MFVESSLSCISQFTKLTSFLTFSGIFPDFISNEIRYIAGWMFANSGKIFNIQKTHEENAHNGQKICQTPVKKCEFP